ncbi:MAG: tetratricopeptide repeat protein [Planctomycetota bacterium]
MNRKDREQELESNLVGDALAKFYKRIEPHSKLILAGVVGVVVALVGYGIYSSGQAAKRSDATLQLLMNNPEVSSQYPGTVAAAWSLLDQGNENLSLGVRALYQDRDEAETLLKEARDLYKQARSSSEDALLVSRANFGVAIASESIGEIDEAIDAYEKCIEANESEQMREVAQERIDALSIPSNQEFLVWFGEQDFAPADPSTPPELPSSSTLPDLPNLDLPDLGLGAALGTETETAPMDADGPSAEPAAGGDFDIPEPGTDAKMEGSGGSGISEPPIGEPEGAETPPSEPTGQEAAVEAPAAEEPAAEEPAAEEPAAEEPAAEEPAGGSADESTESGAADGQ